MLRNDGRELALGSWHTIQMFILPKSPVPTMKCPAIAIADDDKAELLQRSQIEGQIIDVQFIVESRHTKLQRGV